MHKHFSEVDMPKRQIVERELTEEGPRRGSSARGKRRTVSVNIAESPLSWLHARGHLDDRLFSAGERLLTDFERAQMSPNITMRWDAVRIKSTGDNDLTVSERQVAAKARFDGAMADAGKGLQDVLWHVVCGHESLAKVERQMRWPARSGKLVLKLALDRVANFYRIN